MNLAGDLHRTGFFTRCVAADVKAVGTLRLLARLSLEGRAPELPIPVK